MGTNKKHLENDKEEIINEILKLSFKDGDHIKLTCTGAFSIAEKFGIKPLEVGSICNDRNIKVCKCQLGCFK
ncbi:hypothetical protein ACFL6P_03540 [Candidatus Latescibacterota bacterium]